MGFTEERIENDNITLIFKLYESIDDKTIRKRIEKELITKKCPRMQTGIGDRVKPIENMIAELTKLLNE